MEDKEKVINNLREAGAEDIATEMAKSEFLIKEGVSLPITLEDRTFKIRQISNALREKIQILTMEAFMLSEKAKEPMSIRRAKKIQRKIYALHAKTAAYYILGNKAKFIPFLYSFTWRRLRLLNDKSIYIINHIGANNEGFAAFSADWQLSKSLLELSMNLLGGALSQNKERRESVKNMVKEDSQTKQDSK